MSWELILGAAIGVILCLLFEANWDFLKFLFKKKEKEIDLTGFDLSFDEKPLVYTPDGIYMTPQQAPWPEFRNYTWGGERWVKRRKPRKHASRRIVR